MDDEWSKGCECTESALLPFPCPSPGHSPHPARLLTTRKKSTRAFSPRTPWSRHIPQSPRLRCRHDGTIERSCAFRLEHKLVIFYEFYFFFAHTMRAREAGIFDDARQRCRIIARKNSATSSRQHDFIVFFYLNSILPPQLC